jgi:hypothetical protein
MTTGGVVYEELKAENERLKKLLGQCMERQANPPLIFTDASQMHVDLVADEAQEFAHSQYARFFWRFFWRKDFSL